MRTVVPQGCLGLLVMMLACRSPDAPEQDATDAAPSATLARIDALRLLPDGINFIAAVNVQALATSSSLGPPLQRLTALPPFEPLAACDVNIDRLTNANGELDEVDAAFVERVAKDARARRAGEAPRAKDHASCLPDFSAKYDVRLRDAYCSCVADEKSRHPEDGSLADLQCGTAFYPLMLRSTGVVTCEAIHDPATCACWLAARETSVEAYMDASVECLHAG